MPTVYAGQGWDTAQALAAALKVVGSDDVARLRAELRKANFKSIRGPFKFGPNQHPVQDWYHVRPVKGADGSLSLQTVGKILDQHGDAFSKDCKL